LIERDRSALQHIDLQHAQVVLASDLGIPNFDSFIFRHRLYEACGAVKAKLLQWAMKTFSAEQDFLYLDSDIYAYSRFEELEAAFPYVNILLTPHHLHDEESLDGIRDYMMRTLLCGIYNSGFLGIRRSRMSQEFLEWWHKKLSVLCYCDAAHGLYNEQRWLDMAFSFFDITIFREPGYNVANWNVTKRHPTGTDRPARYLVNGKPLRFFHFSMIDSGRDMRYFRKALESDSPVFGMREEYLREVKACDPYKLSRGPWSYDYYYSGERILEEARFAYREGTPEVRERFQQPFGQTNSALLSGVGNRPRGGVRILNNLGSFFNRSSGRR